MKYDFSKCNNLQWSMLQTMGFLKVDDSTVVLCYEDKIIDDNTGIKRNLVNSSFHINQADSFLKEHDDFRIVPRSSSTYNEKT